MPVIDVYHPGASAPDGLLEDLCRRTAELLDLPDTHVWAFWHPVAEGNFVRPDWHDPDRVAAPVVRVRCKASYSDQQAQAMMHLISKCAAEAIGCPAEANFVLLDRVQPGNLLARGEVWQGEPAGQGTIAVQPVAFVRNDRRDLSDDFWGDVVSDLQLDTSVVPSHCLEGLESFSHAEVVFCFHKVRGKPLNLDLRSPRGLSHLPRIGVFAQRVKDRPNWIGVSRCEILSRNGTTLTVRGLDAIDGTPVLDIKPWMDSLGPRQTSVEPAWVEEVMADYYSRR
jgi:tRNA (Thr-GGU) A37 N-methylase